MNSEVSHAIYGTEIGSNCNFQVSKGNVETVNVRWKIFIYLFIYLAT